MYTHKYIYILNKAHKILLILLYFFYYYIKF